MADVPEVTITAGVPTAGTGTVQTISTITDRLGLVSATPGANTLLKRIQDMATDVAATKDLTQDLVTEAEDVGQANMAASKSVVIANDQSSLAVTLTEVTDRLGLVSATPGANTLLKRIQDMATDVADTKALTQDLVTVSESTVPVPVEQKGARPTAWFTLPVLDTLLAVGDLVATDALEITNFFTFAGETRKLTGVEIIDPSNLKVGSDLYCMDSNQSLGSVSDPPTITAANMEKCMAIIPIDAADYITQHAACAKAETGKERERQVTGIGTSMWVNAVVRAAVTYGTGVDLRIRFTSESA